MRSDSYSSSSEDDSDCSIAERRKKANFDDHVKKIWALNEEIETMEAKIEGLVDELSKAHTKKKELQHSLEKEQRKASKPFRVEV
ncbi:unnamed protein product [Urochloa humidicola]